MTPVPGIGPSISGQTWTWRARASDARGDSFSAADVYVGSQIGFGMRFKTIEERPVFTEYWGRISARPALARSTAKNDALLPKG